MNHVPLRNRTAEEIAQIREVVSRHPFPDFVGGFDVELGEFGGNPAMWIIFKTVGDEPTEHQLQQYLADRNALRSAVRDDLLNAFDDRWPYFRFEPVQ